MHFYLHRFKDANLSLKKLAKKSSTFLFVRGWQNKNFKSIKIPASRLTKSSGCKKTLKNFVVSLKKISETANHCYFSHLYKAIMRIAPELGAQISV